MRPDAMQFGQVKLRLGAKASLDEKVSMTIGVNVMYGGKRTSRGTLSNPTLGIVRH